MTATTAGLLFDGRNAAPVIVDAAYRGDRFAERAHRQVLRAVTDLRQDLAMVTGAIDWRAVQRAFVDSTADREARLAEASDPARSGADAAARVPRLAVAESAAPERVREALGAASDVTADAAVPFAVIVGVLGMSPLVDAIAASGRLPGADRIRGRWEATATAVVDDPLPGSGIASALVIAGSDARGAIYGVYALSQAAGVSPWYWYADAPVATLAPGAVLDARALFPEPVVDEGPAVRYRGIFINDEERTIEWCERKFPASPSAHKAPNVDFYRHVFELMLRLRLNAIWPAMHPGTAAFNEAIAPDGTPINAEEAARYGVVVSASHCEMMLRNNVGEWRPWFEAHRDDYDWKGDDAVAAFDYTRHKDAILDYWRGALERNREYENIYPLGIRGIHDGAYRCADLSETFGTEVAMMADVIREQRRLIAEVFGAEDAVAQVFVPYKEIGELYNHGLKEHVPDDVILMWAEDNYGYVRQIPTAEERERSGGSGVYYHNSYWGYPKSWLWLNSIQYALMAEELRRSYLTGATGFWILNVGDITPGQIGMELYARIAWDPESVTAARLPELYAAHARRDFRATPAQARRIGRVIGEFSRLNGTKRAEFFGVANPVSTQSVGFNRAWEYPFSPVADGDEALRLVRRCDAIAAELDAVSETLPEPARDALYLELGHHVHSYAAVAREYAYFWKHRLAAAQGRANSAAAYRELSLKAAREIDELEHRFWAVNGGKWDHAIGHAHPVSGDPYNSNEGILVLDASKFAPVEPLPAGAPAALRLGASAEGSWGAGSGTLRFAAQDAEPMPRYFDVFNRGAEPVAWRAEADPWIVLSSEGGTVRGERRVAVGVDFGADALAGAEVPVTGAIRVYAVGGADGDAAGDVQVARFDVTADPRRVTFDGLSFAEANGRVVIDAAHVSAVSAGEDGSTWAPVPGLGPRGGALKAYPDTAARVDPADFAGTARAVYRVHFTSSGRFRGVFTRIPTLNEGPDCDAYVKVGDYEYEEEPPFTCRTAIGLDGAVPDRAQLEGEYRWRGPRWASNIMRMVEPIEFTIDVPTPGWHDLTVYRSDASIAFTSIMIETVPGALGDGLVGPEESPNSFGAGAEVAADPGAFGDDGPLGGGYAPASTPEECR
ncbi:Glycosyl hydrolase family [Bifidobacterium sp. DSM 109958]|uniref:Glycosyl hydrolase family n=1 Tax=Bifidobacterium moraviense TaxID=2675323 RepID=A0A7Y0F2R3_9BIFI|nr:glycosyl hydrolase 115 family protein [Bifidobacterium sp. DSM 109958]NMN00942.1 Glycosyl hydrolase family [Bifidobacterium sp. DSM 109958]